MYDVNNEIDTNWMRERDQEEKNYKENDDNYLEYLAGVNVENDD